jgi:hypothetical protein
MVAGVDTSGNLPLTGESADASALRPPAPERHLAEYYRERAAECLQRAVEITNEEGRHHWAMLADGWIQLAKYRRDEK